MVAPVLRFMDVGFNADVHIEELGPPDKLISGFAPELFGSPLTVSGASVPASLDWWRAQQALLGCRYVLVHAGR